MRLPTRDQFSVTRAKLKDDLAVAMGGRVAEEIIFGYDKVTTGASSDIDHATKMAKNMVVNWGLSDKVGAVNYAKDDSNPYAVGGNDFSEETSKKIDTEVRFIIDEAIKTAKKILTTKSADLELLAQSLLKYETLTGVEIKDILAGKKIKR